MFGQRVIFIQEKLYHNLMFPYMILVPLYRPLTTTLIMTMNWKQKGNYFGHPRRPKHLTLFNAEDRTINFPR